MRSLDGCHALITGASSGLGAEFARQLAPRATSLTLVARRQAVLEELQRELQAAHPGLEVICHGTDLARPEERRRLLDWLGADHQPIDLLINNAGLGDYGAFADSNWKKVEAMLRVNVEALTQLSHALLPSLIRRRGAILNVSSLASLAPLPGFAVYAATKAFVSSFSEALRLELRGRGVDVLAFCPGPVSTGFGQVASRDPAQPRHPDPHQELLRIPPQECVRQGLAALEAGKPRHYPGLAVAATAAVLTLLPLVVLRPLLASRPRR